jgi:hypothetical protein
MMHLFQMADQYLDESHRAIKKIGLYAKGKAEDAPP